MSLNPIIQNTEGDPNLTQRRSRLQKIAVVLIFSLALIIRIYAIFGFNAQGIIAERQFRSAMIARAYYFRMTDDQPEWRTQVAFTSQQRVGVLEPPIMELIVASIYRIFNNEYFWIARLLSSLFWIVGGIFLYKIAKRMMAVEGALIATVFYLFIPFGVDASISFLPEPLMILMFLFSIFTLVWYFEKPAKFRLIFAAIVSGLAMLVKPFIIFAVLGAYVSLVIYDKKFSKRISYLDILIFLGISLSISSLYYLYGIFIAESMSSNFQAGFLPYLYFQRDFWVDWLLTVVNVVGFAPLILAILGIAILSEGWARVLVIGMGIGYLVFGLVYTYPIKISYHYHLQLIVIIAISIGPVTSLFFRYFRELPNRWYWWLPIGGALLLVIFFNIRNVRGELASQRQVENEEIAQHIGEIVDHSTRTIYVSTYYGMPLEYYAELSGTYWPRRYVNWDWVKDRFHGNIDQKETNALQRFSNWLFRQPENLELSIAERFAVIDFIPEFFVITDFNDFERNHADINEFLSERCTLVERNDQYLIYYVEDCVR